MKQIDVAIERGRARINEARNETKKRLRCHIRRLASSAGGACRTDIKYRTRYQEAQGSEQKRSERRNWGERSKGKTEKTETKEESRKRKNGKAGTKTKAKDMHWGLQKGNGCPRGTV